MHIPDLDIYQLANLLMKSRGDGAAENTTRRAKYFAGQGDVEGEAVWRRWSWRSGSSGGWSRTGRFGQRSGQTG